jgi:hypothetical protein
MTQTASYPPEVEEAAQRLRETSERVIDISKKNGLAWLEASEKVLESVLRLEQQAAEGSQAEWATTLATTHADFVREMSQVYLGSLKSQLA